jgi:hypothetical protein
MPKIEAGTSSANLFTLDGLEYAKNQYQLVYNEVEVDSNGDPDLTKVYVGLQSKYTEKYIQQPTLFSDWTNTSDVAYATVALLLADLDSLVGFETGGGVGYTAYSAILNQTGTGAPVPTILQNDTGLTFTWARSAAGTYTASVDGDLTATMLVFLNTLTNASNVLHRTSITYDSKADVTNINVNTFNDFSTTKVDDLLVNTSFMVMIY